MNLTELKKFVYLKEWLRQQDLNLRQGG